MADLALPVTAEATATPAGELAEYDVSQAARQLGCLRFAEYFLIFFGLGNAPILSFYYLFGIGIFDVGIGTRLVRLIPYVAITAFGIVAYLDSGKLKPRTWRRYRLILPLAIVASVWMGVDMAHQVDRVEMIFRTIRIPLFGQGREPTFAEERLLHSLTALTVYSFAAAVAFLIGVIGLLRLARARLQPTGSKIVDLLTVMDGIRRAEAPARGRGRAINGPRGLLFIVLAIIVFYVPKGPLDLIPVVWELVGFLLLVNSRQYLQVSADSLLAAERRRPILFLRAFVDDPSTVVLPVGTEVMKLVDFSIETRLANHFMDFGPFIAVGSPRDKAPRPGAARVSLSEDHWQQAVIQWMAESSVIAMYAGITHWVDWELSKVIEGNMAEKLILLFPSPAAQKGRMIRKRPFREHMINRFARAKAAFAGTRWQAAWEKIGEPETLIGACFDESGEVMLFRSRRRNNDAFQIAAEIGHLAILGRLPPELAGSI